MRTNPRWYAPVGYILIGLLIGLNVAAIISTLT
jgi:hypothetical protein